MKLTLNNYHTLENRYLTKSRMKDFQKCKKYFHDLHISGERKRKGKEAFVIGSAVDTWLTRGKDKFIQEYIVVSRRNLKNPPVGYTELTEAQYEEIVGMCEVLESQPAYKELKDYESQKIIKLDLEINEHFIGLAAIPDWIKVEKDRIILVDLKTSQETDSRRHHFKCLDYGYYAQFAVMTIILRTIYPNRSFVYRHLVVEKDTDGINTPHAFILSNERIEHSINQILDEILPEIAAEKKYEQAQVSWETAEEVGAIEEQF